MNSHDRQPPRSLASSYFLPLLLLVIVGAVLIWRFFPVTPWDGRDPNAKAPPITPRGELADDEKTTIAIFNKASPSVVHITTSNVRASPFSLDLLQIPRGAGTGFIWDDDGHVVTNFHVIQGADAARVTLNDHSDWQGRLVGAYPDRDLAVLVIDAPKARLRPLDIGASHDLQVGQKVFAIGNPFGLDQSLTTGVISALGREIESVTRRAIKDMIQTDAAINPGNSGGPLLDSAGRLIGVNTAIFSPSGAFAGFGFAIPVDSVRRVVPQLIRDGKVSRPRLGVQLAPEHIVRQLGLKGVLILDVEPDSAAAKAGLRPTQRDDAHRIQLGDLIVAVAETPIRTAADLLDALERHNAGDTVSLTILRNGAKLQIAVTLS
ncbi:MAG: trypsin-like peptidase domain-containing protein [Gemmataceae bacterium]|nr:trypsin-like peptidase domain-containing protein [Gemmataceae bacterium]